MFKHVLLCIVSCILLPTGLPVFAASSTPKKAIERKGPELATKKEDKAYAKLFVINSLDQKIPDISWKQAQALVSAVLSRSRQEEKQAAPDVSLITIKVAKGDIEGTAKTLHDMITSECKKTSPLHCVFLCFGEIAAYVAGAVGIVDGALFDAAVFIAAPEQMQELTTLYISAPSYGKSSEGGKTALVEPASAPIREKEVEHKMPISQSEPVLAELRVKGHEYKVASKQSDVAPKEELAQQSGWWGRFKSAMYDLTVSTVATAKSAGTSVAGYVTPDPTISYYPRYINSVYCVRNNPLANAYGQTINQHGAVRMHNICIINGQGKPYNLYTDQLGNDLPKFIVPTRQYRVNYDFMAFMCSATDVKLVIYRFVNFNPKTGQFIGFNGEHFGHLGLQRARELFAADLKVSEQVIDSIQRMEALVDIRFLVADLQLMHRRYVPEVWKP